VFGRRGRPGGCGRGGRGVRPGAGAHPHQRHAQPVRRDGPVLQRVPRRRRVAGPLLRRIRARLPVRQRPTAVGPKERFAVPFSGGRRHVPGHAVLLVLRVEARRRFHQPTATRRHGNRFNLIMVPDGTLT